MTYKFDLRHKDSGEIEPDVSIYDYFLRKYKLGLQFKDLPVIETTRKGVAYPMEVCHMLPGQRYPFKLNELQTSNMIKFAVARPADRKKAIEGGLNLLDWRNDPFLNNYGLKIDPNMLKTDARLLNPPNVLYGKKGLAKPGYSGRWDLRGKTFLQPNSAPLKAWGVSILGNRGPTLDQVNAFIRTFIQVYRGHGGQVANTSPIVQQGGMDGARAVEQLFNDIGNSHQARPQMMMFILPFKHPELYNRIKKSTDCRYGVVSQCLQMAHVLKNQPQYHSNVCMKFNAKLGGTTCRVQMVSLRKDCLYPGMLLIHCSSQPLPVISKSLPWSLVQTSLTERLGRRRPHLRP